MFHDTDQSGSRICERRVETRDGLGVYGFCISLGVDIEWLYAFVHLFSVILFLCYYTHYHV